MICFVVRAAALRVCALTGAGVESLQRGQLQQRPHDRAGDAQRFRHVTTLHCRYIRIDLSGKSATKPPFAGSERGLGSSVDL